MRRVRHESARALLIRWGTVHRYLVQAAIGAVAWAVALAFATVVRWNFDVSSIDFWGLVAIIPLAALAQIVAGLASGLYLGRWRFGSFEEVAGLARAAAITTALLFAVDLLVIPGARMIPVSAALAGGVVAFALMGGARYVWRLGLESRRRPSINASRLIVYGAGEGGAQVIQVMLRDPSSPYVPVALLDDDPRKSNLRIMGVPVVGARRQLVAAASRYAAEGVLIAIPSAGADLVGELTDFASE